MAALERFLHDERSPYPTLIKAALAHVQFETIHPFLDGNGRMGRLLIAFILHNGGVLSSPLLYLSLYLKQHRSDYYRLLDSVRVEGDWESWLDFFLQGVEQTATNAVHTAQRLATMFKEDADRVQSAVRAGSSPLRVFHALCEKPITTVSDLSKRTTISFPAVTNAVRRLEELGIAKEVTGGRRNRIFSYARYLAVLNEGIEPQ
jgi:Fic family protein